MKLLVVVVVLDGDNLQSWTQLVSTVSKKLNVEGQLWIVKYNNFEWSPSSTSEKIAYKEFNIPQDKKGYLPVDKARLVFEIIHDDLTNLESDVRIYQTFVPHIIPIPDSFIDQLESIKDMSTVIGQSFIKNNQIDQANWFVDKRDDSSMEIIRGSASIHYYPSESLICPGDNIDKAGLLKCLILNFLVTSRHYSFALSFFFSILSVIGEWVGWWLRKIVPIILNIIGYVFFFLIIAFKGVATAMIKNTALRKITPRTQIYLDEVYEGLTQNLDVIDNLRLVTIAYDQTSQWKDGAIYYPDVSCIFSPSLEDFLSQGYFLFGIGMNRSNLKLTKLIKASVSALGKSDVIEQMNLAIKLKSKSNNVVIITNNPKYGKSPVGFPYGVVVPDSIFNQPFPNIYNSVVRSGDLISSKRLYNYLIPNKDKTNFKVNWPSFIVSVLDLSCMVGLLRTLFARASFFGMIVPLMITITSIAAVNYYFILYNFTKNKHIPIHFKTLYLISNSLFIILSPLIFTVRFFLDCLVILKFE